MDTTSRKDEIKSRLEPQRPTRVFAYLHGAGRIGVLVELEAQTDFCLRTDEVGQFAHEVCLQIASMNPCTIDGTDCDARALAYHCFDDELSDKPNDIRKKIIQGKMAKWDKENSLLLMPWVKDNSKTIGQMLDELSEYTCEAITIVQFARFGS